MKTFKVTEKEVKAAFDAAKNDDVKSALEDLFYKGKIKPNLDDYKSIQSYEDACEALGIVPIVFNDSFIGTLDDDCEDYGFKIADLSEHIVALIKLETISRALWGRNFQPKPDADGSKWYYYPWFALYTQKEIDKMDADDRGAILSAYASYGAVAGVGCSYTIVTAPNATVGFRLCQESKEKTEYFGKQFIDLWAEYYMFNFKILS